MNHAWSEARDVAELLHNNIRWFNTVSATVRTGTDAWTWGIELYVNDWAFEIERSGDGFTVRMWLPIGALWHKSYDTVDDLIDGIQNSIEGLT